MGLSMCSKEEEQVRARLETAEEDLAEAVRLLKLIKRNARICPACRHNRGEDCAIGCWLSDFLEEMAQKGFRD